MCHEEFTEESDEPSGGVDLDAAVPIELFEEFVERAIDELPQEFVDQLDNVVFLVEEEPLGHHIHCDCDRDLLGLYEGVALIDGDDQPWSEPNHIWIFRGPTLRICTTVEDVAREVRTTVFHEVAHHFGIDEDTLHATGWG